MSSCAQKLTGKRKARQPTERALILILSRRHPLPLSHFHSVTLSASRAHPLALSLTLLLDSPRTHPLAPWRARGSWVASFTKEQAARATTEYAYRRRAREELEEAKSSARVLKLASCSHVDRRQRAVRSAESARDSDYGRSVALLRQSYTLARAAFSLEAADEVARSAAAPCAEEMNVLKRRVRWALNTSCVSDNGMRRKLERMAGQTEETPPPPQQQKEQERRPISPPPLVAGSVSESGGAVVSERLSVLLDCPQLRRASDAVAVSHVFGLDAAPALLALMPGCVALLYGYELAGEDEGGYVTARLRADASSLQLGFLPSTPPTADSYGTVAMPGLALPGLSSRTERYRRISNGEIAEIAKRRHQLQPWALQLLLHDGETILLSVAGGEGPRDKLCDRVKALIPRSAAADHSSVDGGGGGGVAARVVSSSSAWLSIGHASEVGTLTDAWQRGTTSNFEYLMQLNHVSGRCFDGAPARTPARLEPTDLRAAAGASVRDGRRGC